MTDAALLRFRGRECDHDLVRTLLAQGELVVVETDDDLHLGTVEVVEGALVVRSGYVGRPVLLDADEVVSVTPACGHPDVEVLTSG
jgi:hypothetical protein